ncbi:hypothetical protein LTR17_006547 [Elasticomyces elasticus]|nr:hypothetical protein LTR17_006547 [Elasticomyces elasticus]
MDSSVTASTEPPAFDPNLVPWAPPNGNYGHYALHCHCGAIRWNMKLSPPLYAEELTPEHRERYTVSECMCSYCIRNGVLAVHPFVKDVEWTRGLEHRVLYLTAAKENPLWICGKCHCLLGADLTTLFTTFGVPEDQQRCTMNMRMLKDFDPKKLVIRPMTVSRDMGQPYKIDD